MKVRKVKILSGPYGGLYGYVKYYDSFIRTITTLSVNEKFEIFEMMPFLNVKTLWRKFLFFYSISKH